MTQLIDLLQARVKRLNIVYLGALGGFNAYEQLQEYLNKGKYGDKTAKEHAEDLSRYTGFIKVTEQALATRYHIELVKIFVPDKTALTIHKLIKITKNSQTQILAESKLRDIDGKPYPGLSDADWIKIERELEKVRLKIKLLRDTRNKEVAHLDIKGRKDPKYNTYQDFSDLIELYDKLINKISIAFSGNAFEFSGYRDQVITDSNTLFELISRDNRKS